MAITKIFGAILCIHLMLPYIHGHKILYAVPISGKSHWVYAENFIEALLNRGHEVTAITNYEFRGQSHQNYTEVLIKEPINFASLANTRSVFTPILNGPVTTTLFIPFFSSYSADHVLSDKNVQLLLNDDNAHFDLIINHEILHDSFLALGHRFKASVVGICPFGVSDSFDRDMGLLTPTAYVPSVFLPYNDKMSFLQRWYNTMFTLYDRTIQNLLHVPLHARVVRKHFGHLESLPSMSELLTSRSLIFINMHRAFAPPRPSMNLVYIGGAHIKEPKPLSDDLQTFIDESKHGVVYFSFGTVVDGLFLNSGKLQTFLNVLGKLKQRVIWKCNNESIVVPSNVLVRKWLPQIDILAHPKTRLFISHGGLFSNIESMKFGVPMLVIPFYGDQLRNAKRIDNAGYGIYKELDDIDEDTLMDALNSLISHESYSRKAQEISRILNDNIVHPMDEFIWWSEYVIRTNGAKHLKSYAAEMSTFTYLLVDVFVATVVLVLVVILTLRFLFKKIFGKRTASAKKNE